LRLFPPALPAGAEPSSPLAFLPDPAVVVAALTGTPFANECERLAEEVLARRFPLLGLEIAAGPTVRWRRDYSGGIETQPLYFRRVPYLDPARVGDHKVVWELNRHQQLVLLAQAWRLTGRREFLDDLCKQMESWFEENPFQCGINFCSALEVAFRSLSWMWVYHLAGNDMPPACRRSLLTGLYQHGEHLATNLSYYFSPNTHLLGEGVALHAIGRMLAATRRGLQWIETGRRVVQQEWRLQVRADGSHFEQSSYYHVYAVDMFLFDCLLAPPEAEQRQSLTRMAHFLDMLLPPGGDLPSLGDDDGGRFFHPFGARGRFGLATLATCGVFLDRPEWIRSPAHLEEQCIWWLGPERSRTPLSRPEEARPRRSEYFDASGLAVMVSADTQAAFDAGGFGALAAGHSHADALHIVVSHKEQDLLLDPGTYLYADAAWRNLFRGTAAHNAICVNGHGQADPAGPFSWKNRPAVNILRWQSSECRDVAAARCSYFGFEHRRTVVFEKELAVLMILDELSDAAGTGAGRNVVEQFWHAGAPIEQLAAHAFAIGGDAVLTLAERTTGATRIFEGREVGWRSPAYGCRIAAPVLCVSAQGRFPMNLAAVLDCRAAGEPGRLTEAGPREWLYERGGRTLRWVLP